MVESWIGCEPMRHLWSKGLLKSDSYVNWHVRPVTQDRNSIQTHLDGDLHEHNLGLDKEDFCHDVFSGVVSLLEKDLKNS